jgi:hypothetical protein
MHIKLDAERAQRRELLLAKGINRTVIELRRLRASTAGAHHRNPLVCRLKDWLSFGDPRSLRSGLEKICSGTAGVTMKCILRHPPPGGASTAVAPRVH